MEPRASACVVGLLYGWQVTALFPTENQVSWQGHLFGFAGGVLAAIVLRSPAAVRPPTDGRSRPRPIETEPGPDPESPRPRGLDLDRPCRMQPRGLVLRLPGSRERPNRRGRPRDVACRCAPPPVPSGVSIAGESPDDEEQGCSRLTSRSSEPGRRASSRRYYAGFRGLSVAVIDALPEPGGQVTAMYPEKAIFDVAGFPTIKGRDLVANLVVQAGTFDPTYVLGCTGGKAQLPRGRAAVPHPVGRVGCCTAAPC